MTRSETAWQPSPTFPLLDQLPDGLHLLFQRHAHVPRPLEAVLVGAKNGRITAAPPHRLLGGVPTPCLWRYPDLRGIISRRIPSQPEDEANAATQCRDAWSALQLPSLALLPHAVAAMLAHMHLQCTSLSSLTVTCTGRRTPALGPLRYLSPTFPEATCTLSVQASTSNRQEGGRLPSHAAPRTPGAQHSSDACIEPSDHSTPLKVPLGVQQDCCLALQYCMGYTLNTAHTLQDTSAGSPIRPVQLVQVDVRCLQPPQAALHRCANLVPVQAGGSGIAAGGHSPAVSLQASE